MVIMGSLYSPYFFHFFLYHLIQCIQIKLLLLLQFKIGLSSAYEFGDKIHFAALETRRELEPKCVPQLFLISSEGLYPGTYIQGRLISEGGLYLGGLMSEGLMSEGLISGGAYIRGRVIHRMNDFAYR